MASVAFWKPCSLSVEICLHEHLWGPSPFLGSAGAEVARRADRGDAHKGFTQLRAARMRKTLLLLCGFVLCSCSGACGATRPGGCWGDPARKAPPPPPPAPVAHGASFY